MDTRNSQMNLNTGPAAENSNMQPAGRRRRCVLKIMAGWLAVWLGGWLAGWVAVWLAGWLAG